ncbi:MAG: hypothetical protein JNM31_05260 [Flavobacteriales bacterium]|nr:hypothetical protein [Flavobacteriales bacterium]
MVKTEKMMKGAGEVSIGAIFGKPAAMSRYFTLLATLTTFTALFGQGRTRTVETDTGRVVLHYFTAGQLSTKEWLDKDGRWGRSWAYNRLGEVIFQGQTRRFAGHASVHFSYHPNGAVSKVETSDAPDGGIQWYRSTTTFDADGNRTGFWEDGRDNYGPIHRPTAPPEPVRPGIPIPPADVPHKQPEVVICQRMFSNELFVVNPTKAAVRVTATPRAPTPALPGGTWTMAPGDTIRIGTYSMGESWPPWKDHVELVIHEVVLGDRQHAVARFRTDEAIQGPEHRKLFVVIEGWAAKKSAAEQDLPPSPTPQPKGEEEKKEKKKRWWRFW